MKIIKLEPFRINKNVIRKTKSKVGIRSIRVSVFSHWEERIKDGESIIDKVNQCVYMNAKTYHEFMLATENMKPEPSRHGMIDCSIFGSDINSFRCW